ncbi:centromere protein K-like isoform X2 [Littorina saxatilis]
MLTDMQRQVSQVKETVSLVKSQRQELLASMEREEQYKEQLVAVNEKLQEKSNSLEAEDPPQDAVETVTQELENKINAAGKTEEAMMKKLADFVEEHFPLPEPAQIAKTSKDLRSRKQQSGKETLQLKVILLELMTKCVESPNDPYLMLDERHWPAYIELLLRCNIILQHPDNDRRIKLVPFHL